MNMQERIEELFANPPGAYTAEHFALFGEFKEALNAGGFARRARCRDEDRLARERLGEEGNPARLPHGRDRRHVDRDGAAAVFRQGDLSGAANERRKTACASCRAARRSATAAIIGRGVTCMPPMYINVGAWVDDGTMVDSHALIGSCAQVGKSCHISAAAQIGGVLEPVGAMPVIIEDEVLVGGNCGVYEGTVVKTPRRAGHRRDPEPLDAGLRPRERRRSQRDRRRAAGDSRRRRGGGRGRGRCPRARAPSGDCRSTRR